MDSIKRQNLVELGAERLTDILLDLSGRNDEVADLVERLAAAPEENIKRFKARLAGLKRAKRFVHRRGSYVFARQLEDMLAALKAGTDDWQPVCSIAPCSNRFYNAPNPNTTIMGCATC